MHTTFEALTFATAIIGVTLGLYNAWAMDRRDRVRIVISPLISYTRDNGTRAEIVIRNLSY